MSSAPNSSEEKSSTSSAASTPKIKGRGGTRKGHEVYRPPAARKTKEGGGGGGGGGRGHAGPRKDQAPPAALPTPTPPPAPPKPAVEAHASEVESKPKGHRPRVRGRHRHQGQTSSGKHKNREMQHALEDAVAKLPAEDDQAVEADVDEDEVVYAGVASSPKPMSAPSSARQKAVEAVKAGATTVKADEEDTQQKLQELVAEEVVSRLARASLMHQLLRQHQGGQGALTAPPPPPPPRSSPGRRIAHGGDRLKPNRPSDQQHARVLQLQPTTVGDSTRGESMEDHEVAAAGGSSTMTSPRDEAEILEGTLSALFKRLAQREPTTSVTEMQRLWSELSRVRRELETNYRAKVVAGEGKGLVRRLWMAWYKEIDMLQGRLRGGGGDETVRAMHAQRLETVLQEAYDTFDRLLDMETIMVERDVVLVMVARGDLCRYRARIADKEGEKPLTDKAEEWYRKALGVCPGSGQAYNQLGVLSTIKGDSFGAVIHYARALVADEPFSTSRENLMALLERWRAKQGWREATVDVLKMSQREHRERSMLHLLVAVHMCQSKTDLSQVERQARAAGRHLGLVAQRTTRGAVTDPTELKQLERLCRSAALLATCTATYVWLNRKPDESATLTSSTAGSPTSTQALLPDQRAALSMVWELCLRMAGESEVAEGWDIARGGALVVLLEWLRGNEWAWTSGLAKPTELSKAVQRRLATKALLTGWQETGRQPIAEDAWMEGLRGFPPRPEGPPPEADEDGDARAKAQMARCRVLMQALEADKRITTKVFTAVRPPTELSTGTVNGGDRGAGSACGPLGGSADESPTLEGLRISDPPSSIPPSPPHTAPLLAANEPAGPQEVVCPSCTNIIELQLPLSGTLTCEFCSNELPTPSVGRTSPPPPPSSTEAPTGDRRGLLVGVNLQDAIRRPIPGVPPSPAPRPSSVRGFPLSSPSRGGSGGGSGSAQDGHRQQLIVLDAPNIAMRHGMKKVFSCKGIALAMDWFRAAGHRVVAFMPDYLLDYERVGELKRAQKAGVKEVHASKLPDNLTLLEKLMEEKLIVPTPSQDYDDSYCIRYARSMGGYVVTNDMYRDHVEKIKDRSEKEKTRKWLKTHLISYCFVGDELVVNPDFSFTEENG